MAARSLASLTLSFGLVNVPVKLYSATDAAGGGVKFNFLSKDGARVKQQYVSAVTGKVIERADMIKGYEFEEDRFVTFTPDELKVLDDSPSHVVEIVAFVPEKSVDPIYYDKAYFLAPDKRGGKPYQLLLKAMRESGRCALARWSWKAKQYVVQIRPGEDGLVLQQLLYSTEVRSQKELNIEPADVSAAEMKLAIQLIDQISEDAYDPSAFKDEEKQRILDAIDKKIAGKQVVSAEPVAEGQVGGGQVIDLMDALRASLSKRPAPGAGKTSAKSADVIPVDAMKERKPVKRVAKASAVAVEPVRAKARR